MGLSAAQLETLVVRLTANTVQYDTAMGRVEARAMALSKKMAAIGTKMSMMLTLPIAGIGYMSAKAFAGYDDAMKYSQSIMRGLTDELREEMDAQVKSLVKKGTQSITELAESYYYLASAGMDAKESMAALPKVQAFATAGNFNMATATDKLTDALMAFGLPLDKMVYMGDKVAVAATLANDSVQGFSEMLTADAASAARSFGLSLETTLGILGAYASAGKKAADGGNMFGRMLRLVGKAYLTHQAAFEKYKIGVVDEETGGYRNPALIIQDMERAFATMTAPERTAALDELGFKALAQRAILPILGHSNFMLNAQNELLETNTGVQEMAAVQMSAFGRQMKVFKNQLHAVGVEIGEQMAPGILRMNARVEKGITWWGKLTKEQKGNIVQIAKWTMLAGPMLIAGAKIVETLIWINRTLCIGTGLWKAYRVATIAGLATIRTVAATVAALAAGGGLVTFGWVAALVVGLGAVVALLVGPAGLAKAWDWVKTKAIAFWEGTLGFLYNWKHNLKTLWNWFRDNWKNMLADAWSLFKIFVGALPKLWWMSIKYFPRLMMVIGGALNWAFHKIFNEDMLAAVGRGLKALWEIMKKGMGFVGEIVAAGVAGLVVLFNEIPKALWEGIKAAGGLIKDMMVAIATFDAEALAEAIGKGIGKATEIATEAVGKAAEALGVNVAKVYDDAVAYGNTLIDDFGRAQEDPLKAAKKLMEDAGAEVAGMFSGFDRKTKGIHGLRFDRPMEQMAEGVEDATGKMESGVKGVETALGSAQAKAAQGINLRFHATGLQSVAEGTADFYAMMDKTRELNSGLSGGVTLLPPRSASRGRGSVLSPAAQANAERYLADPKLMEVLDQIAANTDPDNNRLNITEISDFSNIA